MTDKTKYNAYSIESAKVLTAIEITEEDKYRRMWEKMLKIEQLKKEQAEKKISQNLANQRIN